MKGIRKKILKYLMKKLYSKEEYFVLQTYLDSWTHDWNVKQEIRLQDTINRRFKDYPEKKKHIINLINKKPTCILECPIEFNETKDILNEILTGIYFDEDTKKEIIAYKEKVKTYKQKMKPVA